MIRPKIVVKPGKVFLTNCKLLPVKVREAVKKATLMTAYQIHNDAKILCVHPRTKVLTNDGWKPIKDISTGELIVTESGKMKPVEQIVKSKPKEIIRLYINAINNGLTQIKGTFSSISASPEHIIKTSLGWKKFGDIIEGEKIYFLASKCKECGKLKPFFSVFCSQSCGGKWKYKHGEGEKGLKIGHVKAKEFAQKRDSELIIKKGKEWRENNPEKVKKYHARQGRTLAEFYKKYPEKHPNAVCAKNHFFTKLERKIKKLLQELNIDYIHQFKVCKYWADFSLPNMKILLECDGEHWHRDKNKEDKRDKEIKKLKPDYRLIHLSEEEINNITMTGLSQYLSCGLGDIRLIELKVKKIKRIKTPKYCPHFIDLVINGGKGTFIANGFLVHNCPVDTGRLRASISVNWTGSGMSYGKVTGKTSAKAGRKPSSGSDGVGQPPKEMGGFYASVGTNVEYAEDVENYTSPYLWPAFAMNREKYKAALVIALGAAIKL